MAALAALAASAGLGGCELRRGGLLGVDGGEPRDAGVDAGPDGGRMDGGPDGGPDAGVDAGQDAGPPPVTLVGVAAGELHTCALLSTGEAYCWGLNDKGQLGTMDMDNRSAPTAVLLDPTFPTSLIEATQIASSWNHTCVIRGADDQVWCWGAGGVGRLGNGAEDDSNTPVQAGDLTQATDVATGKFHTCATLRDQTARCWGGGADGRLGNDDDANTSRPVEVLDPVAPADPFRGFVSVALGQDFSCALDADGGPWCWGKDDANQLGAGNPGNQRLPIHALRSMAATDLFVGALGIGAGLNFGVAFTADPALFQWGGSGSATGFPVRLDTSDPALLEILDVAVGHYHGCFRLLPSAGAPAQVRCWGRGSEGQLGNGDTVASGMPVTVLRDDTGLPLEGVTEIAAGGRHSCAIVDGEELYCWGSNNLGQLGRSGGGMFSRAVQVTGLPL